MDRSRRDVELPKNITLTHPLINITIGIGIAIRVITITVVAHVWAVVVSVTVHVAVTLAYTRHSQSAVINILVLLS